MKSLKNAIRLNPAPTSPEESGDGPESANEATITELRPAPRASVQPLLSPAAMKLQFPLSARSSAQIDQFRQRLNSRVQRAEGAPIAIVGPCSIHCEQAALEYAERLVLLQKRLGHQVQIVMRVYFEKPRTTVGWKGFLYDPDLDGSDDLARGLARARALMVQIAEMGIPIATEILDPLAAEYIQDCLSWVAIGARTSESQIHRQLASRLPCPVGFKNGTDGSVDVAICASQSAAAPHTHLGIDEYGSVAMLRSEGNSSTHLVLRGGANGPNFDKKSVASAAQALLKNGRRQSVLVDCSHANSEKDFRRQPSVARAVMEQMGKDHADVMGLMIESHLSAGKQSVDGPLRYGVSVTDGCIDFQTTEALLEELAASAAQ